MSQSSVLFLMAVLVISVGAALVGAGEMKADLDGVANPRLLDTHFGRYGFATRKSILLDGPTVSLLLPANVKGVDQTGLYSYVGLLGVFEVAATFHWVDVPMPKGGYGVSCGIVVDTEGAGGSVSLARGFQLGKGSGYLFICGIPDAGKIKYKTELEPTRARRGRLILRREESELVFLAGDGDKEPLRELRRYEFTTLLTFGSLVEADRYTSPNPL